MKANRGRYSKDEHYEQPGQESLIFFFFFFFCKVEHGNKLSRLQENFYILQKIESDPRSNNILVNCDFVTGLLQVVAVFS